MNMKCQKCKSTEDLIKNSKNPNGGYSYMCRKCNTERAKSYRNTPKGYENIYKAVRKSIKKYPEKQSARIQVFHAIKNGELCKPTYCEDCSKKKEIFAHHEDYSKALDVTWLCRICHVNRHKT